MPKHIHKEGYPERAKKFYIDILEFTNELKNTADSFAVCRHNIFANKNYKCVPYKKNYVVILSIKNHLVTIHNIIPAKKIR